LAAQSGSPTVVNETVLAAKEFLDGELAKYETWEHADKSIRVLFSSNRQFQEVKKAGVGRETVLAAKEFLDGELAKYGDWNHVNKSIKMIFTSNSQFQNCKQNGVGQTTIIKFLGGKGISGRGICQI